MAATLVNPVGIRLWATSVGYVGNAYLVGHTAEYLSPDFHDVSTWPFLLMILGSPWILAAARRAWKPRSLLLLLGWTALGLYSVRHVAVYAVMATPILAEAVAGGLRGTTAGEAWLKRESILGELDAGLRGGLWPAVCVLVVGVLMALGVRLTPLATGNAFSSRAFPVQAMDWAIANPPGERVFNYFPWGGYLLFRAWPDRQVFIDGQTDFYGEALTREYEKVITLEDGWEQVLARIPRGLGDHADGLAPGARATAGCRLGRSVCGCHGGCPATGSVMEPGLTVSLRLRRGTTQEVPGP